MSTIRVIRSIIIVTMDKYQRNVLINEIGIFGQDKLKNAKVFVAGLGGLGSFVLYNLASTGIIHIGIVDFDNVGITNFNRQIIYDFADLNQNKAICAKRNILKYNPDLKIETYKEKLDEKNIESIIEDYDIIIDCTDNYKSKFLLNDFAVKCDKKLIYGGVEGFLGQVSVIDKNHACLRCIFPDFDINKTVKKGIISPVVSSIASIQAMEAVKIILGAEDILYNKLLTINCLKQEFKKLALTKNKLCKLH